MNIEREIVLESGDGKEDGPHVHLSARSVVLTLKLYESSGICRSNEVQQPLKQNIKHSNLQETNRAIDLRPHEPHSGHLA